MVRSAKHEKSVLWSDHSDVNKPLHTFHFSHVFVLWTCFADFLRVIYKRLMAKQLISLVARIPRLVHDASATHLELILWPMCNHFVLYLQPNLRIICIPSVGSHSICNSNSHSTYHRIELIFQELLWKYTQQLSKISWQSDIWYSNVQKTKKQIR